jgi:hypothetical protein
MGWGTGIWGGSGWGSGTLSSEEEEAAEEITGSVIFTTVRQESGDKIDFLLDDNGDLVLTSDLVFSIGINAVAQGIRIRIQTFRGEWFLDLDHGVPYYQDLLGHKYNEIKARAAFRDAILSSPGVDDLLSLEVEFNNQTRELTVEWEVQTSFGIIEETLVLET